MARLNEIVHGVELVLIIIIIVLFILLITSLVSKLRTSLPWYANCWSCNRNTWMKFSNRNSWICPLCEQYNGFTKDGDYNKKLCFEIENKDSILSKSKHSIVSPVKNGLCKMCNINQQLKVTQLANFVPINEKKFEEEVDAYRACLEKAYKLCSPCKKHVQRKLYKEKQLLLDSKVLEIRSREGDKKKQKEYYMSLFKNTNLALLTILLVLLFIQLIIIIYNNKKMLTKIINVKDRIKNMILGYLFILEDSTNIKVTDYNWIIISTTEYIEKIDIYFDKMKEYKINYTLVMNVSQRLTVSLLCFMQFVGHVVLKRNTLGDIFADGMLLVMLATMVHNPFVHLSPLMSTALQIIITFSILMLLKRQSQKPLRFIRKTYPSNGRINTKANKSMSIDENASNSNIDSDDDVSLNKFGLQNLTDSSSDNNTLNCSFNSGRTFSPRLSKSLWRQNKNNSTFTSTPVMNKTLNCNKSLNESIFSSKSFGKYQDMAIDDSDSDLEENISTLCIGSPKKSKRKMNSMFLLRKFDAPNFIAPSRASSRRPLISPSKLLQNTSWVAGGYWGSEGERQLFNIGSSRSSSQSSGFESQASSNQRNLFSQPPSREESVCGDMDGSVMMERFQHCNLNFAFPPTPSISRLGSPIFPQMSYNNHVYIPQARFPSEFSYQHKMPGILDHSYKNKLFKLPQ